METIKFTETIFSNKEKKGILTPDQDGYYTVVLGGLNVYNSVGEYYTSEGALQLFENSSVLMRRIKNGSLYAELGHPKKLPTTSMEEFYNRIVTIDENNVCGHISEVTLDFNYGKSRPELGNKDLIAVVGKVKPAGPKGNTLKESLENPKQNSAFSVRGLTENKFRNNKVERKLTNIITWDYVIEPGISIACKAYSPVLESRSMLRELSDVIVDKNILKRAMEKNISIVATENSRLMCEDILKSIEPAPISKLREW